MEKKQNASKLISSLVALSLATTLGVPSLAFADGQEEGSNAPASEAPANEAQPTPQEGESAPSAQGVAEVNGTAYATLQEAVEAATSDSTITILQNVSVDNAISVDEDLTIDFGGHTVAFPQSGGFDVSYVEADKNLTLKNGTLSAYKWAAWLQNGAHVTVAADMTVSGNTGSLSDKCGITVTQESTLDVYGTVEAKLTSAISGNGTVGLGVMCHDVVYAGDA